MKKFLLFFSAVAFVFLSACSSAITEVNKNTFYFKETGVEYLVCPKSVEAKAIGESVGKSDTGIDFFLVSGAPKEKFLTTGDGAYKRVFVSANEKMPEFADFRNPEIFICSVTKNGYVSPDTIAQNSKKLLSGINEAISQYPVSCPIDASIAETHALRFESPDEPYLYYFLWIYSTSTGDDFIYDEGLRLCWEAGELLKDII